MKEILKSFTTKQSRFILSTIAIAIMAIDLLIKVFNISFICDIILTSIIILLSGACFYLDIICKDKFNIICRSLWIILYTATLFKMFI